MGYRYAQLTKLVETGEYEAVLRQMEIRPTRFDKTQGGWEKYGDQPVCSVNLYFEILDGSPGATNPDDWLWYHEYWPDPDSTLDRIVKMVEGLGIPHIKTLPPCITTLPLGHCFRVRISTYSWPLYSAARISSRSRLFLSTMPSSLLT